MSAAKHTPGPWKAVIVQREPRVWGMNVVGAPGCVNTVARLGLVDAGFGTVEANARLIALAPTMYQLLLEIATDDDCCTCAEQGWYGQGHTSGCRQEMAGELIQQVHS